LTQKIFRQLVTPERTRAIVELADLYMLGDQTEVARILEALVNARLLVVQTRGDAGGGSAEIVHESLIDRWPTMRRWLDEDQEDAAFVAQLQAAAKQWEAKGKAGGLLWRGEAMEEAQRWFKLRPREMPPREREFLEAVFAVARRGKRLKRFALITVMVVLGGVAVGASVMMLQIREAQQLAESRKAKAEEGEKKAKDAEIQALEALEKIEAKERERLAAEEKQKLAEAEKDQVQVEKQKVEAEKEKADQKVAESAEELKAKNLKLEATLKEVEKAKSVAEQAKVKAEAAEKVAKKAKDDIAAINREQADRIKRLEDEKAKLTTKLK
jgi:eukaryotic-like serine/threonine-protein kinase